MDQVTGGLGEEDDSWVAKLFSSSSMTGGFESQSHLASPHDRQPAAPPPPPCVTSSFLLLSPCDKCNVQKFPRSSVWDPYKLLGVSPGASEEEIWSSRNFLLQQYVGHESSEESIEAAFERILMDSFWKRKKSKINLKSKLKKQVEESPSWVKNLLNFVELPPKEVIFRRLFLFAFMGGWSIMNSAEGGPAFQVAVSLAACIYFLNEKTKSVARASLIGFGALVAGWVCGSFLVPMIPSVLLRPTWTLELLTSLVVYVYLFLACTFLK
ncbi:unnamed protein product [Rhodiola kirilowii]